VLAALATIDGRIEHVDHSRPIDAGEKHTTPSVDELEAEQLNRISPMHADECGSELRQKSFPLAQFLIRVYPR